jgi:hypothetical protein
MQRIELPQSIERSRWSFRAWLTPSSRRPDLSWGRIEKLAGAMAGSAALLCDRLALADGGCHGDRRCEAHLSFLWATIVAVPLAVVAIVVALSVSRTLRQSVVVHLVAVVMSYAGMGLVFAALFIWMDLQPDVATIWNLRGAMLIVPLLAPLVLWYWYSIRRLQRRARARAGHARP